MSIYDIAVIGGGINGTGVAADASGRNLKVFLCEQNDLASGTSSASSKLIHGGLRYLEHYEFRLVKEALAEREVLMQKAPHLVSPLRFTMPHRAHLRPAWMIRTGLFLYDHLTRKNSLPKAKKVKMDTNSPLDRSITKGFQYYDCWVDDARLVVSNARHAANNGARVSVQTQCRSAKYLPEEKLWALKLFDKLNRQEYEIKARHIVNAAGPWLNQFLEQSVTDVRPKRRIRLIKGSHIVVPRVTNEREAYILQNEDKRIVFVLPYLDKFSIIGTTDEEYQGDPKDIRIAQWEIDYLLDVFNKHFENKLNQKDIVSSYSGVRPLCDDESTDPSAITRDYTLELNLAGNGKSALLSIYGGKITTYRKLAEAVLEKLAPYLPNMGTAWTNRAPLPGCTKFGQTRTSIRQNLAKDFAWLPENLIRRFSESYGDEATLFLQGKHGMEDMGKHFGQGLYESEVLFLIAHEWATCAEDIIWRRTKLGLTLSERQIEALQAYIDMLAPGSETAMGQGETERQKAS